MKKLLFLIVTLTLLSSFNFAQTAQGLVGYWPFNGNANDMSGNGNNGTIYGASLTTGRDGTQNGAYYFDGVSSYISMGNSNFPITNEVTISLWFKTTNQGSLGHILTKYGWTNNFRGFGLGTSTDGPGYIDFFARDQYGFNVIKSEPISFADDNWHFIAASFNSSLIKICFDGSVIDSIIVNNRNDDISNNYNLILGEFFNGSDDQGYHFQGSLDDIRVYNRSLSQSEINQLYNENNLVSTYTLSLSSNPTNGGSTIGAGTYPAMQQVTIQASPATGYGFLNWTENNSVLSTSPNYTIILNYNRSLVANFVQQFIVTALINPDGGGQVANTGSYINGSSVKLTATPSLGYSFINWKENGLILSTNPIYNFTIVQNRTITANFQKNTYLVTLQADPTIGGTVLGNGTYDFGSQVTVSTIPNSGYKFLGWYENGTLISIGVNCTFNISSNRTLTARYLGIPLTPTAFSATDITLTNFTANWNPVDGSTGYYLDVALDIQFKNIFSSYNKKNIGNYVYSLVDNLVPGTLFYYRVYSYNDAGISLTPSNTITVLTLPMSPSIPVALNPTDLNETGFTAKWTKVSTATGYYFDLAIDENMQNILIDYNKKDVGNVISFPISGLITNLNYYYRVKAYNTGGESDYSNIMKAPVITGIDKLNSSPTVFELNQNYPNPFNPTSKIQFSIAQTVNVKLSVYNVLGEQVAKLVDQQLPASTYSINFNASNLPGGIYFYRIIAGDFVQTKKMILLK